MPETSPNFVSERRVIFRKMRVFQHPASIGEPRIVEQVQFEKVITIYPHTKKKRDAVAVIRNGHRVAILPEFDRLTRALSQPLETIYQTVHGFRAIMNREPTHDEREFWQAVLEFKRSQQGEQD